MTSTMPRAASRGRPRVLGPGVGARGRRRAGARVLGVSARLGRALRRADGAQSADGGDRVAAAGRSSRRARARPLPRARAAAPARACDRVARAVSVDRAGADLVRVRQPHELFGALRRRARRLAAQPVSVRDGGGDSGRAAHRSADRSIASATGACCCCLLMLPPAGLPLLRVANGRLSIRVAALVFGAGFGLMHPAYTAYVMAHVPFAAAAPRSARCSRRSTPASAPARRRWAG